MNIHNNTIQVDVMTKHYIYAEVPETIKKKAVRLAQKTAESLDLDGVNNMLDLGGGSGAYAIAFAKHKPEVSATVFDLPTVIPLTQKYVSEEGLENQVKFIEGDMIEDDFGNLVSIERHCRPRKPLNHTKKTNVSFFCGSVAKTIS